MMTTRTLTTILAALLALAIVAPAAAIGDSAWGQATDPAYDVTGYANAATGDIWIAGRLPMATERDARALVATTDAGDIERNLDMIVLAQDTAMDLAPLGIGPMDMYAGLMGGSDAAVLVTSYRADVWVFVFTMDDFATLDADAVVRWTVDTMLSGVAASPGAGFLAMSTTSAPAWGGKQA